MILGATDTLTPLLRNAAWAFKLPYYSVSLTYKPLYKLPKTGQRDFMENIHRETNKEIRERKVFLEYVIRKAAAVPVAHSLAIHC